MRGGDPFEIAQDARALLAISGAASRGTQAAPSFVRYKPCQVCVMPEREFERVPMLGLVAGEIMVYEPLSVTALSVKGLAVDTRFPLHLNSLHEMRLTLGSQPVVVKGRVCLLYTSPSPRDQRGSRMPSSA